MGNKNPKKKNETSFKKGNSASVGNKGRRGVIPGLEKEGRELKAIDNFLISGYLNTNSHSTIKELRAKLENPKTTALEGAIMQLLVRAFETGDKNLIDFVLDRTIGKVSAKLEIENTNKFQNMTFEQLINIKKTLESTYSNTLKYIEAEYKPAQEPQQEETPNAEIVSQGPPES